MSDVAIAPACYHCHAEVGDGAPVIEINGTSHPVCCAGCGAAALRIHELDLDDFYRYRDRIAGEARTEPAVEQASPGCPCKAKEERRIEFAPGITSVGEGQRLSVRVPDIRCAACTWLIEKSLAQRSDVDRVRTNLADRVVTIDYAEADPLELIAFIEGLGFTVLPDRASAAKAALDTERKSMLGRLGVAGIGMMQVMMFALATYLAGDDGIEPAYRALMHWASLAIAIPIAFYSALPFHRGALRDLKAFSPGMDVPVSLAILAAFSLSFLHTITGVGEVYYDSVAMFTFLLLIGRYVELGSRRRYQQSQMISESLLPAAAELAASGQRIPVANVVIGDEIRVRPGQSVPVDGIVTSGESSVVESAFTGESKPVSKAAGSRVLAGADNLDGEIIVRVSARFDDFVITRVAHLYRESALYKPRFSTQADVVARYFVTAILLVSALSATFWFLAGSPDWFSIALAVLVVSCPCALSLATPVAYTVAVSAMRNQGVVISNGKLLERLSRVSHIVFDKTGTLTKGRLKLTSTVVLGGHTEQEAREIAAALEQHSRHPIALAFEQDTPLVANDVEVVPGSGVSGVISGHRYRLGAPGYVMEAVLPPPDTENTWVLLGSDEPVAWFQLKDELRDEAAQVVANLMRTRPVSMFTGDASDAAMTTGREVGIADIETGMTPEQKVHRVRALQDEGAHVLMVGDGINDTAAMAAADVAIAVSPVDLVVQEAADATLLRDDLACLPVMIGFAEKVNRVIRQNIIWAVAYNICVIPLAVAGLVAPWMAALGMSASSILVVLNANRLQRVGEA